MHMAWHMHKIHVCVNHGIYNYSNLHMAWLTQMHLACHIQKKKLYMACCAHRMKVVYAMVHAMLPSAMSGPWAAGVMDLNEQKKKDARVGM